MIWFLLTWKASCPWPFIGCLLDSHIPCVKMSNPGYRTRFHLSLFLELSIISGAERANTWMFVWSWMEMNKTYFCPGALSQPSGTMRNVHKDHCESLRGGGDYIYKLNVIHFSKYWNESGYDLKVISVQQFGKVNCAKSHSLRPLGIGRFWL